MAARTLRILDTLAVLVLATWAGLALGALLLPVPAAWQAPAQVMGDWVLRRVDLLSFLGFGLPLALVLLPRWLDEVRDPSPVGALRLWTAAILAALLVCFASLAIVAPQLALHRTASPANAEAWGRSASVAKQFLLLRIALALVLAGTVSLLPRKHGEEPEGEAHPKEKEEPKT